MEIGAPMKEMARATAGAAFAVGACLWLLSGCGYRFAGTGNRLPTDVHTIGFGPVRNSTREVGIEKQFLEAFEDELVSRGRLSVVPANESDVVLSGTVRDYQSRPVAFSSNDVVLQYQASVAVDLELRRRDNGKLLWKTIGQRETQDYSAVPGVVVTSSSQFQRQTLNAKDLGQFTDIQLSEGQRREANEKLIETLSREVYNQMMEDF
jgi:lipopolysaccharide assembly LptE-like protein